MENLKEEQRSMKGSLSLEKGGEEMFSWKTGGKLKRKLRRIRLGEGIKPAGLKVSREGGRGFGVPRFTS